jgi:1-acyl-sn-glycerol-3-phosphate acyltransferase
MTERIPKSVPGFRTGCRILLHALSDFNVEGRQNFPTEGGYIICGNHLSYVDGLAMGAGMIHDVVGFAAKKYQKKAFGLLFRLGAPLWIEQESPDRRAIQQAIHALKSGRPLGIAPEGTRSKSGVLQQGKEGAAYIATRANVPIVPTAMWGTENVFKQLRPTVQVVYGKPFRLPKGRAKTEDLKDYTEMIMCAIAALLPEEYHGYYAGNTRIEEMAPRVRNV